jgi:hypothetical protein
VAVLPTQAATFVGLAVIAGGCRMVTLTLNEQLLLLPDASVAVQVTLVEPAGKVEPLAGVQALVTPGQLSVAVAVNVTTGAVEQLVTVMSAGQVIAGA